MNLLRTDTVVMISDLHIGDPTNDRLDDFDRDRDFEHLLTQIVPRGCTLVIAGDFIDFPQVMPEVARRFHGDRIGASEDESVDKIQRVLLGHPLVFATTRDFLEDGGRIVLLAGNHDVDFHWEGVRSELRLALGGAGHPELEFVAGGVVHERGIYIEHGNQYSFDNRFEHWGDPRIDAWDGKRLERPWGTLFMDLAYNEIEEAYPFVNKVYPQAELAWITLRSFRDDERISVKAIAHLAAFFLTKGKRFMAEHLMGGDGEAGRSDVRPFLRSVKDGGDPARLEAIATEVRSLLPADSNSTSWTEIPGLLGRTDEGGLERRALELHESDVATIVAFGHTHQPLDGEQHPPWGHDDPRRVFNTGSWMPRISIGERERPHLSDLARRKRVHEVRYLRIELSDPPRARLERLRT